jgi:hypothetical protein
LQKEQVVNKPEQFDIPCFRNVEYVHDRGTKRVWL